VTVTLPAAQGAAGSVTAESLKSEV
jgi:hypothetical protein